jgi:endonuclease YncB( thermonuclease family)
MKGFVWLLFLCLPAYADTITGKVVVIADGDTITVVSSSRQYRIRIGGIDAPEKRQPFGNVSKQHLAKLAFGKEATAECYKTDRYGRQVCTVFVGGEDVGLAQVEAGLAWWFRRYANEQ